MRTRLAAPLLAGTLSVVALLGLSACGGSSTSSDTVPPTADVVVRAVEGIAWNEKAYTATATDGKVEIYGVNDASIAHNLYVLDGNDKVIGDYINLPQRGASGTLVLPLEPGEYHIVCKIPGHNNLNSTLTVS